MMAYSNDKNNNHDIIITMMMIFSFLRRQALKASF